jgi:hypothetical protein
MDEDEEVEVQKWGSEWQARFPSQPDIVGVGKTEADACLDLGDQLEARK